MHSGAPYFAWKYCLVMRVDIHTSRTWRIGEWKIVNLVFVSGVRLAIGGSENKSIYGTNMPLLCGCDRRSPTAESAPAPLIPGRPDTVGGLPWLD